MAMPLDPDARLFYRVATQRFLDAELLLDQQRTTGAVYLAGYSVECMLKAVVLAAVPAGERVHTLASFRGRRAHDYDWLRELYRDAGGSDFPKNVAKQFTIVNTWAIDLRYQAGTIQFKDAERFLEAARAIMAWADGRL
jgi:HEPN domain-containing protein